jgi:hypothetical protein
MLTGKSLESLMRASIFVFLIVASIQTVAAQDATGPVIPDERQIGEATKQLTAKLIEQRMETSGFVDIRVSPVVHVVKAKDKDGKQIVLVLDPATMRSIPLTPITSTEDEADEEL